MNPANKLTLSRFGIAFVMSIFLTCPIPFGKILALFFFLIAGLTDYWDGRWARNSYGVTAFGQLMDPLADKTLVSAAFISFVALDQLVPAWIVIAIVVREFLVTALRLLAANQGKLIPAGRWGKHKMMWQVAVIFIIIFGLAIREDIFPLFLSPQELQTFLISYDYYFHYITLVISFLAALLTVVSGTIYFWQFKDMVMRNA